MSALLYAPAVLIVLLESFCWKQTFLYVVLCGAVQFLVGLRFLWHHPISYISKAFEFHRVFLYEWTVNWKFLPEHMFQHPLWSLVLLSSHILVLYIWYKRVVRNLFTTLQKMCQEKCFVKQRNVILGRGIVTVLFQCQLIGIVFARSIHYQFYTWYFHSLPWILYSLGIHLRQGCVLLLAIELVYNKYPPSWHMSILLQCCHLYIISKMLQSDSDKRIIHSLTQSIKTNIKSVEK
ncbi:Probable Dol-P-Man:Man(5)GlcNAc(2)-PP-Dol alpha-1,3-mannosyltransferase [Galdieria sulphuraria]|nr:Probable Dol-P-Man:Man(5)GlcNAc(2)-PP-Dol alpha-1,3-mannosyltransferase [Galdieria sulphuraria]